MAIAMSLHLLAALIWIGGMLFAHWQLRPVAADLLDPPTRLRLWGAVFARFFPWVWAAIVTLLTTGLWVLLVVFGGFARVSPAIHAMFATGLVMMGLFAYVYWVPYHGLRDAVAAEDWVAGGKHLAGIRFVMVINIVLGLVSSGLGVMGRYIPVG